MELLFRIFFAHVLAETALQPDYMARGKLYGSAGYNHWWWIVAHATVNGGCIYLAAGSLACGLLEVLNHSVIDWFKTEGWITTRSDKALHGFFLFLYWVFMGGLS